MDNDRLEARLREELVKRLNMVCLAAEAGKLHAGAFVGLGRDGTIASFVLADPDSTQFAKFFLELECVGAALRDQYRTHKAQQQRSASSERPEEALKPQPLGVPSHKTT